MSYCRRGVYGSDAYIFATVVDGKSVVECCGCLLATHEAGYLLFNTYGDLLRHVNDHRNAGHHIPASVDDRIRREVDPRWIAQPRIAAGTLPDASEPPTNVGR